MLAIAFVDGRAVPTSLTPQQIQVLFPQGICGLRSLPDGEFVFPSEAGTIHLEAQKHFTLQPLSATATQNSESMASPKTLGNNSAKKPLSRQIGALESPVVSPTIAKKQQHSVVRPLAGSEGVAAGWHTRAPGSGVVYHPPSFDDEDSNGEDSGHHAPAAAQLILHQSLPRASSLTRSFEPRQGKLILDRVHEHLMLPSFVYDIIDTPEFQRLRSLKQLGMTSYLYPGATHTRFEHSIGVAHLAGLMVKKIARRQPELLITDEDILCVTVAGLCHDLGHGPFSHLFEEIVNRNRRSGFWHHEEMSIRLLHRILDRFPIHTYNLNQQDANFIALCIVGIKVGAPWPDNVGRPKEKRFLVEIVSNKRSGIDVDKLDYFMRDSLCCYGRAAVDCHVPRLLAACKVLCFEDEYQICYEEKLALSLGDIFTLRAKLHKYAYQHRIVKVLDHMIADILEAADPFFHVRGKDNKPCRISECVDDEDAFCQMGDWIFDAIDASTVPGIAKAQALIARIKSRDLYTVVGTAMFARYQHRATTHGVKEELLQYIVDDSLAATMEEELIIDFVKITYGSSDSEGNPDDPINSVTFYNPKSSGNNAFRLPRARQSPLFSPSEFGEKSIIVMVRNREFAKTASVAFQKWRDAHTRNLGVEVPVYNISPNNQQSARGGAAAAKRAREERLGAPIELNLGGGGASRGSLSSQSTPFTGDE
jgi:deoxynucleoside triphosphate triphosphohydrolase SAMHD1